MSELSSDKVGLWVRVVVCVNAHEKVGWEPARELDASALGKLADRLSGTRDWVGSASAIAFELSVNDCEPELLAGT
jgi:hypothetical protein